VAGGETFGKNKNVLVTIARKPISTRPNSTNGRRIQPELFGDPRERQTVARALQPETIPVNLSFKKPLIRDRSGDQERPSRK